MCPLDCVLTSFVFLSMATKQFWQDSNDTSRTSCHFSPSGRFCRNPRQPFPAWTESNPRWFEWVRRRGGRNQGMPHSVCACSELRSFPCSSLEWASKPTDQLLTHHLSHLCHSTLLVLWNPHSFCLQYYFTFIELFFSNLYFLLKYSHN